MKNRLDKILLREDLVVTRRKGQERKEHKRKHRTEKEDQ